jgi:phospholipid/cholesterol/gamma-HCH transport system substrate-binding protein
MRTGAEIKVGLITVLAVVLVAAYVFYVRGYRAPAMVYRVSVVFEDASGLQRGDTVRLAGVKIGEVKSVAINKQLKAQADLTIDQRYDLYDSYTFQIVTSGLLQERFVEVIPAPLGPDAALLSEGSCVDGVTAPGVSDLLSTTAEVLGDLDEAAQSMRLVFADAELLATFKSSLLSFSEAARAAVELAERASALTEASHELIVSGLEDIRGAAEDVHAVSEEIRTRLVGGEVMVDVEETAAQARPTPPKPSPSFSPTRRSRWSCAKPWLRSTPPRSRRSRSARTSRCSPPSSARLLPRCRR